MIFMSCYDMLHSMDCGDMLSLSIRVVPILLSLGSPPCYDCMVRRDHQSVMLCFTSDLTGSLTVRFYQLFLLVHRHTKCVPTRLLDCMYFGERQFLENFLTEPQWKVNRHLVVLLMDLTEYITLSMSSSSIINGSH